MVAWISFFATQSLLKQMSIFWRQVGKSGSVMENGLE
jgi:hypothetical protein